MESTIPYPYSVEVLPEATGFRWKVRGRGKLLQRSDRVFPAAEKAQEDAVEHLQRKQHGD